MSTMTSTSAVLDSDLAVMPRLDHLRALEAESIHILRELVAEFERPVMLYSIGKDSSVMLRLAQKAFYPGPIPFPLLHVDTTYKFREMIEFRDQMAEAVGARLIVHTNEEAIGDGTQPFKVGTQRCCGLLKTKALLDALQAGNFDAAIGTLYFAKDREVIVVGNSLIVQEQPFVVTMPGEKPQVVKCRMRSLGCSPCTGAIRSDADTLPKIIEELISTRQSERQLRIIDHDQDGSMELKKREGYF